MKAARTVNLKTYEACYADFSRLFDENAKLRAENASLQELLQGTVTDFTAVVETLADCKMPKAAAATNTLVDNLRAALNPEFKLKPKIISPLESENARLKEALSKIIDASDQFVRDTGLRHGDLITDAVDKARAALGAE